MTLPVRSPVFGRSQEALQELDRLVQERSVSLGRYWASSTRARVMCSNSRR